MIKEEDIQKAFNERKISNFLYRDCFYKDMKHIQYYSFDPHYVYFIGCGHYFIKIGLTKNIKSRFSSIQTGMPFDLKIIGLIDTSNKDVARCTEKYLHKLFEKYHKRGEWFEFRPIYEWLLSHDFEDRPTHEVIEEKFYDKRVIELTNEKSEVSK